MKVLIVNRWYKPDVEGGAERVIELLAYGIQSAGGEVVLAVTAPIRKPEVKLIDGIKTYRLPPRNLYWAHHLPHAPLLAKSLRHALTIYNPFLGRDFAKVFIDERPDLVHTHVLFELSPSVWVKAKSYGLPIVHSIHSYELICGRMTMFKPKSGTRCIKWCSPCQVLRRAWRGISGVLDAVVGVSSFVLEKHLAFEYFRRVPIRRVIYNGTDFPSELSKRVFCKDGVLVFGYLGALNRAKGIDRLVEEFGDLCGDRVRLLIGGSGPFADYVSMYKDKAGHSGKVSFLGRVKREEFLRQVDVLVVPSLWEEPFGMVVIEAFAQGVPVVAARRGGIPELVEDGRTGFLFEPDKRGELSQVLRRFVDRPELVEQMGRAALERSKHFAQKRMVEEYLNVYRQVLKQG